MAPYTAIVVPYVLPGTGSATRAYGPVALAARLAEAGLPLAGRSFVPAPT